MTNKVITVTILIVAVVGAGAFYGGMKYGGDKSLGDGLAPTDWQGFSDFSSEERQQRFQEFGSGDHQSGGFRGRPDLGDGVGRLTGEVISQGEGSLVIKLANDSTKIVFVTENTEISKTVKGVLDDLAIGRQIMLSGDENPDGSYTAKTIQLRLNID